MSKFCLELDHKNGLSIVTTWAQDVELYETDIVDSVGAYPVERYETVELAKVGHAAWVERADSLSVVTRLGYSSLTEEVTLVRNKNE